MSEGSKNLKLERGATSVWDEPGLAGALDREQWMTVAWGCALGMLGVRRGGLAGGLLATAGLLAAIRAAMGCRDYDTLRESLDGELRRRGWRGMDIVAESSDESFPASDSPAWTSGAASPAAR